jgi:hypothetical protein
MKAFFPTFLFLWGTQVLAVSAPGATVSGPWAELRSAPLFEAPLIPLAPTWGPSLPIGRSFRTEKVYGRWLYGTPEPLNRMPEKDFAKPGWVFSRMLLIPGDSDTLPPALVKKSHAILFHARKLWGERTASLDFLESLTLSQKTLAAFQAQDEAAMAWKFSFGLPEARAADEKDPPPMGLSGTDLNFLDQEFRVIQEKKSVAKHRRDSLRLQPPPPPALDATVKEALFSRHLLQKKLSLPPLTHEELDGFIYMRATAMRALNGCPKEVRDYWKNRRWNFFRFFREKDDASIRHPWMDVALPGGYFALSARSLDVAGNEAEMAFLLVRPLVREKRLKRKKFPLPSKSADLDKDAEEAWRSWQNSQSTKESANLDVADEIAVDLVATECISRAGYRPMSGLSYMRKLSAKREENWAKWHFEHSIGWDYRLERLAAGLEESLLKKSFPEGKATNPKRFTTASRHWNLLP